MPPNYEQFAGFSIEQVFAGNGPPPGTNPYDVCEPGIGFFLYPPPNSAAVLSTAGGTRQFRGIENWTPDRQIRNWWAADIQRVCDEYRRNMPEACRNVATVHHVYDLYRYFDAYDIYKLGVTNLTRVVNTLVYENTFVQWSIDVEHGERAMFEAKAAELLYDPLMQKRLLAWKKDEQPNISKIFSHEEFKGFSGFEFYSPYNANIVCGILERHYDTLKRGQPLDLSAASFHRSTSDWRAKILADTQAYQRENKGKTSLDEFMKRFILTTPVDDAIATTTATATATAHPTTRTIDNASVPPITDTVVNGIVIVDGTSKTAAIRAQQTAAIGSTKKSPKVQETRTPEMSGEDETIRGRSAVVSRPNDTLRTRPRGLSAPMRGGDPGLVDASTRREPRIYSGQSHEVHKVLYGCLKKGLDGPSGTSQESMEDTQAAAVSSSEIAISTPEPIVTDTAIHGTAQAATASSSEDPMPEIVSSSATNPIFAPIPVRPTRIYSLQNNARSSSFGYPGQVTPMAPRPAAGVLFNPHEPAPLPPMATGPPSGNIPDTRGRYRGISFNQQLPVNVSRPPQIRYTSQPPIVLPGQQPIYINAQSVSITYITNTVTGAPGQMPVHHQNVYVHTIPQQGVQQGPQQNVPQQQMHHPNVPQQTMRQPSSMAQPVPDSSRNPMQHRRNAGPGSNGSGRWLRAGANDLHGPRVIFRKDTDPSRNVANQRPAQQFEHATDPNRRVSAAVPGVNANHQPFANASFNRPPPGLRYPASGYPRPLGHDPSTLPIKGFPCVNITKAPTPATKFDPCRCFKCHARDRTIYIGGFRSDLLDQDFVTDRLTEYFVQYGLIDNVHPVKSHVYIRYFEKEAAIAAVKANLGQVLVIEELNHRPLIVNFACGSQFYQPNSGVTGSNPYIQSTYTAPQLQGQSQGAGPSQPAPGSFLSGHSSSVGRSSTPLGVTGLAGTLPPHPKKMMYPPTRPAGRPSPVNGSPSSQVQGPRQQYSSMPSSSSQAIPRTTDQDAVAKAAPRDPSTPTEAGPVATTSSNDPRPSSAEVSEDRVSSTLDGHDNFDTAVLRKGKKPVRGAIPEEWRQAASKPPVLDTDESQGYQKSAGQVSDVKGKSKMVYANAHHEAGQDRSPMDNKHPIGPVSRQLEDVASTTPVEAPPLPRSPERKAPNIAGQNVTLRLPASAVHAPMYTRRISSGGHRHPSMLGWSEPFPEYRDLMSGRQPVQTPARRIGHNKGLGSIASVSSSTSTATFGRKVPEVPGPKEEDDRTPTRANPVGAPSPRISEKPPSESKSTDKNATHAKTRQGSPLKASHTEDTGATDTIKPTSTKEKKKRRGGKQGKQGKQDKQAQTSTAPETSTAQTSDTLFKPEQRDNLPPAAKDKSSTSSSSKHDTPKVTKEDKQNMIAPPSEKKTPSLVTEDTTRTTNVAKVPAKGIETSPVNVDKTKKASTAMKTTTAKSKSSTPVQPKESSAATDVKSKMDRPKSRTDLTSSGSSSSNASSGSRSGKKKGYRPARQKQARPDAAKAQAADSASQKADGLAVLPKFPIIPTSILPATPANRPHRFAPPPKQTKVPGRKVLSAPTSPPGHKGDGCSSKEFKP